MVIAGCEQNGASPSGVQSTWTLRGGDRIDLASGLSLAVAPGFTGDGLRGVPNFPTEQVWLAGDVFTQANNGVIFASYSQADVDSSGLPGESNAVIARSASGEVEVRWRYFRGSPGGSVVSITTRLPGKLTGLVFIGPSTGDDAARTAKRGYAQAVRVWEILSVEGVELPELGSGVSDRKP